MGMFSNDVRVVNTATPAFHTEPNVTQYGWTKSDAAYYNQLIQYVDEARQIYTYISEKVIYFDGVLSKLQGIENVIDFMVQISNEVADDAREVRAATAYVSQTKTQIDIIYRNVTADFAIFNSKYADFTVKYEDVLVKAYDTQLAAERAEKAYQDTKELYDDLKSGQVYRGTWDPTTNAYPDGAGTNSTWDVVLDRGTVSHDFDNKNWRSGDRLIYALDPNQYYQIATGSGVDSINGMTGSVTLDAHDVEALPIEGGIMEDAIFFQDSKKSLGFESDDIILAAKDGIVYIHGKTDPIARVGARDYKFYHVGNKPSAADVNALAKTGDTLLGNLRVGNRNQCLITTHGSLNLLRSTDADDVVLGNTNAKVYIDAKDEEVLIRGQGSTENAVYHKGNLPTIKDQDGIITSEAEVGAGLLMRVNGTRDQEIRAALAGATGGAYMSETPPPNPFSGARWFDTNEGRTFLWYEDGDSEQWVEENPQSADIMDGSPRLVKLADEGILDLGLNKKGALTVKNGSSISYQDQGYTVFHSFAEGNAIEWAHGINGENTLMTLSAGGVLTTNAAIYADSGFVCQSKNRGVWVSIEAADGVNPYIASKSVGESVVSKTVEFNNDEVKFNKKVSANHTRIAADGGLQFSPTNDMNGTTWGMGVNPTSRTLGVYQYSFGAYVGAVWDADSARNVNFHAGLSTEASFLCRGGSESSYHQVRNGGNPTVELHEPAIAAVMMYKPQGTTTLRFAQSNGAGGEARGYGGVDSDGFFTTSGRYRSIYQAANRSWTAVGSTPFYAEGISVGNGSFRSIAGGYSVIPNFWSLESTYGIYCENSPETTSHILQMTDGGGFNRFWRFANGGALYSPTNWSMSADGTLIGTVFGGYSSMINWCVGSFAPISDEKLKKNIQPSTRSALENVGKIKFHSYEWIDGKSKESNLGMIAQELEQIDPSYTRDIKTFETDGSVATSVKALDTTNLLALALKSIQELEARIKELEDKVNG